MVDVVNDTAASEQKQGKFINTGYGPALVPVDIGHNSHIGLVDPGTAFWMLVKKAELATVLADSTWISAYQEKRDVFAAEMDLLRFKLKPTAVYFNPTERCNLNCTYCYIPADMRRKGEQMTEQQLIAALVRLKAYFNQHMDAERRPKVIFHGAEPMVNRQAVFAGITAFQDDFQFAVQTNATLLDDAAIQFFIKHGLSIGLSLDGPDDEISGLTRRTWNGEGVHDKVVDAMKKLHGYPVYSVITTVTTENVEELSRMVDLFHQHEVPTCMLNVVRCTLPDSRLVMPTDQQAATAFIAALEHSYELFQRTGRKLIIANFANILISILAPTARRLMCDISPCGGGRAFFALAPNGNLFPCSEFIGLDEFCGGNLFEDDIDKVLQSHPFRKVTERNVDNFSPCNHCAIRHYCGSPCPAEAHEMNGGMKQTGAFCEFYEEQVRFAFRLIADGKANAFLWDHWDEGIATTFDANDYNLSGQ